MNGKVKGKALVRLLVVILGFVMAFTCIWTSAVGSFKVDAKINLKTDGTYQADYDSMTETEDAAAALNLQLAAEGAVLLKNKDGVLPLTASAGGTAKVTVLGSQADTLATGGSGSGGQTKPAGDNTPDVPNTLFDSLDAANIAYNPSVKAKYEKPELAPKTLSYSGNPYDGGHYMNRVEAQTAGSVAFDGAYYEEAADGSLAGVTLTGFTDTALIVFSRSGAEGQDNDAYGLTDKNTGAAVTDDVSDHYLQLTTSEKELVAYAKKNFDNIVVLLNCPSVMELGCLEDDDDIGAILWIGQPGWNGIMSVGKILNGEIAPSGRTVDFYMRDFATDPTWYNFGNYAQANAIVNGADTTAVKGNSAVPMGYDATYATQGIQNGNFVVLDYAEGIYTGYRYYETVYAELTKAAGKDAADAWYDKATVYPFGYGLSYTSFSQSIKSVSGDLADKDGDITVTVTVKNTGNKAGKEVVQLYSTPEYNAGGIEKAAAELVGFAKTKELDPDEEQDLQIGIAVKDLASFDYNDANTNSNSGYELEQGKYVLSIRKNSHEVLDSRELTADKLLTWDEDGDSETPNNIFSQWGDDNVWSRYNTLAHNWVVDGKDNYLKRSQLVFGNGVGAQAALEEEYSEGSPNELQSQLAWIIDQKGANNLFTAQAFYVLGIQELYGTAYQDHDNAMTTTTEKNFKNPWVVDSVPADWKQGAATTNELGMYPIELADMTGLPLTDEKWTTFMNQLTWSELVGIVNDGGYGSAEIATIGKPAIEDHDGPGQLRQQWTTTPDGNGYAWACETVIGSTWNTELAYKQGKIIGSESILLGVTGWYGPGMNIHRSPLSGRNFEYYSQDGVHGGYMLAAVVRGATDMGVHVYMKHAFLNDQETSRSGVCTFATEQAIREIYAKPFEIAVRQGNANGIMLSFNRIGTQTSASHAITVQMYEKEWGYDGISVTDAFYRGSGWTPENLVRASTLPLNSRFLAFPPLQDTEGTWNAELRGGNGGVMVKDGPESETLTESATQYYWTRRTAMRALYTYANSNAMTGLKTSMLLRTKPYSLAKNTAYDGENVYSSAEIADFVNNMNNVYGEGKYIVSVDGVPKGMSFDLATGKLSGKTPAAPGVYPVTIKVRGKGKLSGVTGSSTLNLSVAAPVTDGKNVAVAYKGFVELKEGENYVPGGKFEAANEGKYTSVKYTAQGLPEGLTINETTGEITGKIKNIKAVGEQYTVTVTQDLVRCEDAFVGWMFAGRDSSYTATLYMTVVADIIDYHVNVAGFTTDKVVVNGNTGTIADLATPTAPAVGMKFRGWAASADGEKLTDTDALPSTLYALWDYPYVTIINGTFWIDGEDTGIVAAGQNGAQGDKGNQGEQGVAGVGIADITFATGEDSTVITFTLTDGTTKTVTIPNGAKGDKGDTGAPGAPGADGKDAENGGCGGSISTAGISILLIMLIAAIALPIIRRGKHND